MKIFLIRHGESIMNTHENEKIKAIDPEVWLTDKGTKQALQSAMFLKTYLDEEYGGLPDCNHSRVWISPYKRTRETFKAFDSVLGFKKAGYDCYEDFLLAEQEFGLFDSVPEEEWGDTYPNEFKCYSKLKENNGKFYARCPMGESPKDVAIRCKIFFETIWRDYNKYKIDTLFLFVHGTVLRAYTMAWNHYSPEWYNAERNPGNCWIRLLDNQNDRGYIYKGV